MAAMARMTVLLIFLALCGVGFAFFYQPRQAGSRFTRLGQRIRTVAYSYVAAVLIAAAMKWWFRWGL
jgi:hypothetical protein